MSLLSPDATQLIAEGGYAAVALAVAVESMGVPFPGEATLIAAAIYAGTTGRLDIALVVAAAAAGAVLGDNVGFLIGRRLGFPALVRYGPLVGITAPRLKLGQYLFLRHGGKVVFLGRFVAVLRVLAAVLAGACGMGWRRFLVFNAAGGVAWAALVGGAAWLLGEGVRSLVGPIGALLFAVALTLGLAGLVFARRHERRLIAKAEAALPGALEPRPL